MNSSITPSTYIRNLSYSVRRQLADFLDPQDSWKSVLVAIQKPNGQPRYTQHHVRRFEALTAQGRSPTVELLNDWGTTNCTVGELVDILRSQKLLAPASILLPDAVKAHIPEERPTFYPVVETDNIATRVLDETVEQPPLVRPASQPDAPPEHPIESGHTGSSFSRFSYHELAKITDNFDDRPMSEGGRRLGEGGFGIVYKGLIKDTPVAVKKLNVVEDFSLEDLRVQFHQEIQTLELLKHENLVDMVGFSCESHYPCLVYAYMANGSLLDRLASLDDRPPLTWWRRCMIAVGTARGLEYLHSNHHIHRDVKSANILLDENLVAKISDFGLTRASAKQSSTTIMTERIVGTRAYMAPEALRGEITPKSDIFSFGVVLLEILSGLPPVDESRDPQLLMDLRYDIDDEDEDLTLEEFVDRKMGGWELGQVESTYAVACNCLQDRKVKRPAMTQVLSELEDVLRRISPEHEAQESEA